MGSPTTTEPGSLAQALASKAAPDAIAQAARAAGKTHQVITLPVGHYQMTETPDPVLFAMRDFLQDR